MLLAVQAHSDDIPLMAAGTVAKLVKEGYTGYLVRATNDDMGDAPGLGTPGTIGEHVLGNERDNDEVARVLGLKRVFNLNYGNHRMGDVSQNELQCRLIFLIRLLKVDTVVCWDPWAHDEENPDHADDRPRRGSGVLDGRPRPRLSRAVRGRTQAARRPGEVLLRAAAGDHPRGGHQRRRRSEDRGQPRQPGQGAGRPSRIAAPGRAGQEEPAPAAAWATTTRPPTAITSRSSSWLATANSGGNTASSTPKRSTTSGRPRRARVDDYVRKHAVPLK